MGNWKYEITCGVVKVKSKFVVRETITRSFVGARDINTIKQITGVGEGLGALDP